VVQVILSRENHMSKIDSGLQSYDGSIKKNRDVSKIKWTYRPVYHIDYCYPALLSYYLAI